MNDVEKKFGELLRHHEVPPPPAVWDQLSANLAQKRRRRAMMYWRVAAAVVLLLLGTLTFMMLLRNEPAGEGVAQQEQPPASNREEPAGALVDADRTKRANASQGAMPSSDESEASPALVDSAPVAKDKHASEERSLESISAEQSPDRPTRLPDVPSTPQPERPRVTALPPTVPEAADKLIPTAAVRRVLPSATSQPDGSTLNELASSDPSLAAAGAQRRTVTVIYKPGNRLSQPSVPNQNDGLLSKTLSFLEDVKKNGPTYSELRSAKSALIDNVFSRDSAKQQ